MTRSLLLLACLVAACKFDKKSPDFECDVPSDCMDGRVCVGGFCVLGGGADASPADGDPGVDAGPADAPGDGFVCPEGCSRCDVETCVIACDLADSCATPVVCPAGTTCRVECNGRNTCGGTVDCTAAASCEVRCIGNDSCDSLITCGPGRCRVECTGSATCTMGIDCSTACACDTFCADVVSCPTAPLCPGTAQCKNGIDCESQAGPCDSC